MKLKTLFTAALALLATLALALPDDAEARRMGGGGNLGKQYKSMPRQAEAPRPAQTPSTAAPGQRAPQAGGASRWLGPLAGLAAGGLLASLFMGGAFEGLQAMDFIVIIAFAVGAFFLFRMLRRGRSAAPTPAAAGAYGGAAPAPLGTTGYARDSVAAASGQAAGEGPSERGGVSMPSSLGETPRRAAGNDQFPFWFDGIGFLDGAKTHFIRLQAAWDKGDFKDIRDYTTPQLFAELQRERERLGGEQYTEVVRLQAEMVTIQRDGDQVVASVRFSGLIREGEQGLAQSFSEVWHVQHDWASAEGDWYIAGIQQD